MRCLEGVAGARHFARLPALALYLAAAALAAPSPALPAPHPSTLRIGLRQGVASVTLACPAGVRVQDAEGYDVLEATRAVRVEPAGPGAVTTPAVVSEPPAEPSREAAPEGEQAPPPPPEAEALPVPEPGAGVTDPGAKPANPPTPQTPARLILTALDADERTERSVSIAGASVRILSRDAQAPLDLGKMRYRGAVVIERDRRGKLSAVNTVAVDDYLRGVLPAEMSPSAPPEALKAQAIVARTFAITAAGRHRSGGFDLCDNTHCQVYAGANREREATDRAIAETQGQILLSNGQPMPAYFHSTCGGATDGPAEVWGGKNAPACLAGVADFAALPGEDLSTEASLLSLAVRGAEVYCGASPEFHWEFERTRADLERTLSRTLPGILRKAFRLGRLQRLSIIGRTRTGRAAALEVQGSGGSCIVRGDTIRWVFGTGKQALPSARFAVRPVMAPDAPEGAAPEGFRFLGFGSGHGVGLCQTGAIGMARQGHDATRILAHYFPGATIGTP